MLGDENAPDRTQPQAILGVRRLLFPKLGSSGIFADPTAGPKAAPP
jgi:hypothetical protein